MISWNSCNRPFHQYVKTMLHHFMVMNPPYQCRRYANIVSPQSIFLYLLGFFILKWSQNYSKYNSNKNVYIDDEPETWYVLDSIVYCCQLCKETSLSQTVPSMETSSLQSQVVCSVWDIFYKRFLCSYFNSWEIFLCTNFDCNYPNPHS